MCCCDDGNYNEFLQESHHRAKKDHRCHECRRDIAKGERYLMISGKWRDSGFDSFRWCAHCEAAQSAFAAHMKLRYDATPPERRGWPNRSWCWCYSEVWESAWEEVKESSTSFPKSIIRLVVLASKRKWMHRGALVPVPVAAPKEVAV